MKLQLLAAIALLAGTISKAQPVYNWSRSIGSTDFENVYATTSDASGNFYLTGVFNGTVDLDPGPATQEFTSTGDDTYISKFDASGTLVWVKTYAAISTSIAVDKNGNVYTTGVFSGTYDFDPGPTVYSLTAAGNTDAFISKLDIDGNFVWAKRIGGTSSDKGKSITVDDDGNVYTVGTMSGTVDMDPGALTQSLTGNGHFLSKLDTDGNYVWANFLGPILSNAVATDASGNIFITGYFFDATIDFDPGAATYNLPVAGGSDIFLSKFDAAGNFSWAKSMGGTGSDVAKDLKTDASGNIYLTGSYQGTADFDPSATSNTLTSESGSTDIFVTKLNASGDLVWAKSMGGAGSDVGFSINIDASGNVYTSGHFQNTADFDPGADTHSLTAGGNRDLFTSKLDASGNYVWATGISTGLGDDTFTNFVIPHGDDDVYIIGNYGNVVDVDPGPGTQNITSAGDLDVFIVHLVPASLPLTLLQFQAENNGSKVLLNWQTSQEENTASFTIERSADGKNFSAIGSVKAVNNASFKNNYTFNDEQPINGAGFYRLKTIDIDGRYSYSQFVSVRNNNNTTLQLAPNPARNVLYVQAKGNEPVTIQIADVNGRVLQQQRVTLNGNTSFTVNIQHLLPGNYYLLVKGKQLNQLQLFIKQ